MTAKLKMTDVDDQVFGSTQTVSRTVRDAVKKALIEHRVLNRIIGHSKAVKEVRAKIKQVAAFDICVLITGESGTGKELAARAIHYLGPRRGKPFIPVNGNVAKAASKCGQGRTAIPTSWWITASSKRRTSRSWPNVSA